MPCNDVTELMELTLDAEDRLAGYRLIKKSCGRAVGEESLMQEAFQHQPANDLLALSADDFADRYPAPTDEEMFLQLKHFFAVQGALRVLLGEEPGGKDDPVRAARVGCDEEGRATIEAALSVDILTEQIKSCGRCKGCGSIAKRIREKAEAG